ncbi:hypothetical protein BDZ88DRAFT_437584 [Geranomyces variabilis]|nr:hypothetical protein BDZ88DRAFT_437584 [Geranomyces variabilis]
MWRDEEKALTLPEKRNKQHQCRAERLAWFPTNKILFEKLMQDNEKLLKITHLQGETNKAQSEANNVHSNTTAELVTKSGRGLFWGVLDTDDARRMDLISDEMKRKIEGTVEAAMQIGRGPRMAYLLEAETWSHHGSIHAIAKSITGGGLRQLWKELNGHESGVEAVCEDMAAYVGKYAHRNLRNERTMDVHAVASFAKLPGEPLLFYGELMSITDQTEKQCRCNSEKNLRPRK